MTSNRPFQGSGMRSRNNASRPRNGVASKELQEARRRRRQREVMRNRIILGACLALILALIIFLVVKVFGFVFNLGKSADTSTLTIKEDGSVVFEEVTDFDESVYSKSDLKAYTKDLISSFNEKNGKNAVSLDKLSVKGDVAYIKTTYKDAACYSSFTSYETYAGSYEDAVSAGYDFATLYSQVADDALLEADTVDADSVFAGSQVVVVNENVTVNVPGTITYVSTANVELIDSDTLAISQADGNEDASDMVFIIYKAN